MNKCLECGGVFEKPMLYREPHGETFYVCPDCCGPYEIARECEICRGYFHSGDAFYRGRCYDCAKDAYCDELGFAYLEQPRQLGSGKEITLEGDFYLNYLGAAAIADSPLLREVTLNLLRRHFKTQWRLHRTLPSYTYSSGSNPQSMQLKAYCLDDITHWIDFLTELSMPKIHSSKVTVPAKEERGDADRGHL